MGTRVELGLKLRPYKMTVGDSTRSDYNDGPQSVISKLNRKENKHREKGFLLLAIWCKGCGNQPSSLKN